ncbi:MAG: hypothetical protein ACFWT6_02100 [Virgibacillus proomii]|jgi:hypothetical protein
MWFVRCQREEVNSWKLPTLEATEPAFRVSQKWALISALLNESGMCLDTFKIGGTAEEALSSLFLRMIGLFLQ